MHVRCIVDIGLDILICEGFRYVNRCGCGLSVMGIEVCMSVSEVMRLRNSCECQLLG